MTSTDQSGAARGRGNRSPKGPAPAVSRAVLILERVAAANGRPVPLSTLARELSIAKSSCANVCIALEEGRLLRRVPDGYQLGGLTAELGSHFVSQFNVLQEFYAVVGASEVLRNEVVQLVAQDGAWMIYLARHEGRAPHRFGTPLGSRLPALFTASGVASLSQLDDMQLEATIVSELPAHSPVGDVELDMDGLHAEVARTRKRGYAVDPGWSTPGVGGVAVPVEPWASGHPLLAMGVAVPLHEMTEERIARVGRALSGAARGLKNPWEAPTMRTERSL